MSTNVRTVYRIIGYWNPVTIEASAFTAIAQPNPYFILSFPGTTQSLLADVEEVESSEEELRQLFAEFAEEDIEMAEMRMDEYNEILLNEDIE